MTATTAAYRNGNHFCYSSKSRIEAAIAFGQKQRRRQPSAVTTQRPSTSIPTFLCRHSFFRLPLILVLILLVFRDRKVDESSPIADARTGFLHNVWAFHAGVRTIHTSARCRSIPQRHPVSTASCSDPATGLLRPRKFSIFSLLQASKNDDQNNSSESKIRLNKVFKRTHSRREADRLIEEGRVSVNGERVTSKGGFFVVPYKDKISLDGEVIEGWEEMNYFVAKNNADENKNRSSNNAKAKGKTTQKGKQKQQQQNRSEGSSRTAKRHSFEYIKYWKPRGVICTTDPNIPGNIIDEIRTHDGYDPPHRVYPVGRLDKDTTGLILITSDGRLPNAALRKEHKRPKTYEVCVEPPIGPPGSARAKRTIQRLRDGVVISTETVRNGIRKTLTAPTEPCEVEQLNDRWISITLKEGRNRQVRKMTKAVGHRTIELERVSFAGIPLEPGLRGPGDWDYLDGKELEIVRDIVAVAAEAQRRESNEDAEHPEGE